MSIYDEINFRVNEKRLFAVAPALPGAVVVRRIYASPEINDLLFGPWSEPKWEERCWLLRADIDRFIEGQIIPVAEHPFKGKTSYLKRLHPARREVWEIRSQWPKPGIRVLGRFAETDVFIALTWFKRVDLEGPKSMSWRNAIVECKRDWNILFPAYQPKSGDNIHDYISANIFLV